MTQIPVAEDQKLIIEAIKIVKAELGAIDPQDWLRQGETCVRLATLYSLLDVDYIMNILIDQKEPEVGILRSIA
jgi:hypothetical protein